VETPDTVEYKGGRIHLAPSFTDAAAWARGYSVFDSSGKVTLDGYLHGPFTAAERAKPGRAARGEGAD
jgi:hypothetical protein